MADYILIRKGRNALSSIIYIILNILLGVGSIALTIITKSWIPGIALVLLSKWRIFAVRPYYWLLNIKSNLVDLIVGSSFVVLAFSAGVTEILPVHWILAAGYAIWLTLIKPRTSALANEAQALIAVFLGISAAVMLGAAYNSIWLVLAAFIVGYGASRHILVQSSEEHDFTLITFICGLVASEIAWLCHSWMIIYTFGNSGIALPQLAIILTVLGFLFGRVHRSILKRDGKFKFADVAIPTIFSFLILTIMILWFSKPIFDI